MDSLTIFKNKKAFSMVELVVAMLLASIVMLSIYFMLVIVYNQFNDLTEVSENFNNLQVFERMFQRSAFSCQYYNLSKNKFVFYNTKGQLCEVYEFDDDILENISVYESNKSKIRTKEEKIKYYSKKLNINDNNNNRDKDKVTYYSGTATKIENKSVGYIKKSSFTTVNKNNNTERILFDKIVKVYYELSSDITIDNFKDYTGVNLDDTWRTTVFDRNFYKIYTPYIKLIIIYKDNKGRLRRSYLTCRLRGIEGTAFGDQNSSIW